MGHDVHIKFSVVFILYDNLVSYKLTIFSTQINIVYDARSH